VNSAELARRFNFQNLLWFEDAPGGLVRAVVSSGATEAEIYLQGAHVARWSPRGQQPVLFFSSKSLFTPGKAIRGGVPIIFSWFCSPERASRAQLMASRAPRSGHSKEQAAQRRERGDHPLFCAE
jgi:D-hexose-6-phosphate mutarotase